MRSLVLALFLLTAGLGANAHAAACKLDGKTLVTVTGTIRLLRTIITPITYPDGTKDYSIVGTLDVYELSVTDFPCSGSPVLVYFRYGHAKYVSCKDNTRATVTGFYQSGSNGEPPHINVMSPADFKCTPA